MGIEDLPDTKEDQKQFGDILRDYNFELEEFKDDKDTKECRKPTHNNLTDYFCELEKKIRANRKKLKEDQKIGCFFHYTGHGYFKDNETYIFLPDEEDDQDKYYPLERKIRQFNETYSDVYVLSVFDCCRSLPRDQPRSIKGGETDGVCNYTNVFAAEKEKLALVKNFMTRHLVA